MNLGGSSCEREQLHYECVDQSFVQLEILDLSGSLTSGLKLTG
jgi:hypothetical protein